MRSSRSSSRSHHGGRPPRSSWPHCCRPASSCTGRRPHAGRARRRPPRRSCCASARTWLARPMSEPVAGRAPGPAVGAGRAQRGRRGGQLDARPRRAAGRRAPGDRRPPAVRSGAGPARRRGPRQARRRPEHRWRRAGRRARCPRLAAARRGALDARPAGHRGRPARVPRCPRGSLRAQPGLCPGTGGELVPRHAAQDQGPDGRRAGGRQPPFRTRRRAVDGPAALHRREPPRRGRRQRPPLRQVEEANRELEGRVATRTRSSPR